MILFLLFPVLRQRKIYQLSGQQCKSQNYIFMVYQKSVGNKIIMSEQVQGTKNWKKKVTDDSTIPQNKA